MKRLNINQEVKYIGTDPEKILLRSRIFKVIAKHIYRDGSENYNIISEDGYLLEKVSPYNLESI